MSDLDKAAPKEIDRAKVLSRLVDRWAQTAGASGGEEPGVMWVLDQLAELGHLRFRGPALCGAYEGMTGIQCALPKTHVMPDGALRTVHEGASTPEQKAYVGYEMFVRWPVEGSSLPTPAAETPVVTAAEIDAWVEADAPPLPVADPDAYPHYYQSEEYAGELWRVDGLDGPVMWRRHARDAWEASYCRNEDALVAMQGGHVHRFFDEVPS